MTVKERQFVSYYLGKAQGNGTLAATMAGYTQPGQTAYRLLKKGQISRAVDARLAKAEISADEVLARLSVLAQTDATDFLTFDPDSHPNKPPRLDFRKAKRRGRLCAIKKLKATRVDRGDDSEPLEVVEVEFHDPHKALALLGKFHGLFDDKSDDKQTKSTSEALSILRERQQRKRLTGGPA